MAADRTLETARAILERPTAPFREHAILTALDAFAAARPDFVEAASDAAGNRIWRVGSAAARVKPPVLAFTAHVDHPGLVPGLDGRWELLGRVWPSPRLVGGKVRFFDAKCAPAGGGVIARVREEGSRVLTELEGAPAGGFAMFDFPPLLTEGDRWTGRVCDDLMGAIAILLAIDLDIDARRAASVPDDCWIAAFTRAEEVGFIGALAMLEGDLLPRAVPIVGLECSAARGGNAEVGGGPVIRAGDRIATFDPDLTAFLRDCAEDVKREDPSFQYQRRLMQGGACESTAYLLDGRRAGALCLALGNYHNIPDPDAEDASTGLAPEFVSRRDLEGLARLMVKAVRRAAAAGDPWAPTRQSLRRRLDELRGRL
jgi:endoglucanase